MVSLNLERGGADIQETDPQISFQDWKLPKSQTCRPGEPPGLEFEERGRGRSKVGNTCKRAFAVRLWGQLLETVVPIGCNLQSPNVGKTNNFRMAQSRNKLVTLECSESK